MKKTLNIFCFIFTLVAALGLIVELAPPANAYETYSINRDATNCRACHGPFGGGVNYKSMVDNSAWDIDLHGGHQIMLKLSISFDCKACHVISAKFPTYLKVSSGPAPFNISCLACHGREEGASGVTGVGLRQHHFRKNTGNCETCHPDSNPANFIPVGENIQPPGYFTPDSTHPNKPTNACNYTGTENRYGSSRGLDNDGDLLDDISDPDCVLTAPETTITSSPPDPSGSSSATFAFTATEADSTFECDLDGSGYITCNSPKTYTGLLDGSHTFSVRAKDGEGNTDLTPASHTWTIDTGAPYGTISHQATSGNHMNSASVAGTLTWNHTVLPGADKILIVTTALDSNGGATIKEVAFNGTTLTRRAVINKNFVEEAQLWYMLEPPVGTYQITVRYSAKHSGLEARASTYTGVNLYRPFSNVVTAAGSGVVASVTVNSNTGELVIDGLAYRNGGTINADVNQDERYNQRDSKNAHGASEKAGTSPNVSMSWTLQNSGVWAIIAASLMPAETPAVRTVTVRPSCAGYSDCYTSLNEAIVTEASYGSLVSRDLQLDIELYSMSDTTKVDLRPFDGLTDTEHYIRIYTPLSERHQGVWDNTKYHMNIAATISSGRSNPDCILIGSANVWFDGIQLNCSNPCSNYPALFTVDPGTMGSTLKVSNSILRATYSGTPTSDTNAFRIASWPSNSEAHLWNNIIYDLTCSGGTAGRMIHNSPSGSGHWYVYNTTLFNSAKALSVSGLQVHVRNSIANGITTSGWTGCTSDSDYNITNLNETITGSHSKKNTTVSFADQATRDFHLSAFDTAAVDAGQNSLNSPSINEGKDIVGQARDNLWDIGAFEFLYTDPPEM